MTRGCSQYLTQEEIECLRGLYHKRVRASVAAREIRCSRWTVYKYFNLFRQAQEPVAYGNGNSAPHHPKPAPAIPFKPPDVHPSIAHKLRAGRA